MNNLKQIFLGIWYKTKASFEEKIYTFKRFIFKNHVEVTVTSIFYPANCRIEYIWFNTFKKEVDFMKLPQNEDYKVDLQPVIDKLGTIHYLQLNYIEGVIEKREEVLKEEGKL